MYRAYKYRIYPNKKQEELIQKTFGCCRFVYNQVLAYKIELYKTEKKSLGKMAASTWMTQNLKTQYEWLKEVDKFALTNSVFNLDVAYKKFFKEGAGFPKFKSKRDNRKSYTTCITNNNIEVSFEENKIKLPKLKWIKAKVHRNFFGKIKSATISQAPSGKYFVSILVEEEQPKPLLHSSNSIGLDLGIKDLLITSNGEKYENPKILTKYAEKLAIEQRKLSQKQKESKNYEKQRVKVAKIYEKITNTRIDNLHKISHKLISENQVIISEDLSIKDMVQNNNLAKSILDCSWYELTRQLQYKAEWYGRTYKKIDRYFPSSQRCNDCGFINKKVKNLAVREWTCPNCGVIHDRDINAVLNILQVGQGLPEMTPV